MSVYQNLSESQQFACRVIADHARSTAFAITDGILPGNEGRNYVLRKIMRRAIYHGREHLGLNDLFFYKVCDKVVEEMSGAFPELETQREFIGKMVRLEEERFGNTLTVGLGRLNEILESKIAYVFRLGDIARERMDGSQEFHEVLTQTYNESEIRKANDEFYHKIDELNLFGKLAFVYDSYGVPKDLIRVAWEAKQGKDFERYIRNYNEEWFYAKFDSALQELQSQGSVGKTTRKSEISPIYAEVLEKTGANEFLGYDATANETSKVTALVKDDKLVDELNAGDEGLIVLDATPFYAESGGQVGDTGSLNFGETQIKVFDTFAPVTGVSLHKSKIERGSVKVGDQLTATVDVDKRDATRRNHTATHLVHAALREVLGTHVKQAGSVVAPGYLRFDFTHYQSMSDVEITEIEDLVNAHILQNEAVNTDVMSIEDAMRTGAMALFGEKYGNKVRVLSVGGGEFSRELCGGTHVRATGDIGSFKITADEAIASGVRRIRAITGFDAFARFREDEKLIDRSLGALKTQRDNLPSAIEKLQDELKRTRRENDELKLKIATGGAGSGGDSSDDVKDVNGVKVIAKTVDGLDKGGMRHLSDTLMAKLKSGVVILGKADDDKVSFIVRVSDDLTDKVKAGKIVQDIAPIVGGRGGGRPDMAEGGGTDASKLNDAIAASLESIKNMS